MRVLLSIRPPHVENIMSGKKTFEFRRKVFARSDVKIALIYCTKPVGRIVGEFDILEILKDRPDRLWMRTEGGSGISREYFDCYFSGRKDAFALKIGDVRAFSEQIDPSEFMANFCAPQSFMYLPHFRDVSMEQLSLL